MLVLSLRGIRWSVAETKPGRWAAKKLLEMNRKKMLKRFEEWKTEQSQ